MQYDDATISSTSVNVRSEISCGGQGATSGNSWNHYFLLIYPEDSTKRSLYTIKNSWTENTKGGYPWRGPAYTLTKTSTASSYSLPPIWLINDGYDNTANDAGTMYNRYKEGGDRANIASGNLVNRYPVESINGFAGIRSDAVAGTIEIIDNTEKTEEQELVEDLIQIVTVFSCRLQGKRANKAKKMIKELIEDDTCEKS